jgi:ABC-type enterochelin transport system substrate-binding protein
MMKKYLATFQIFIVALIVACSNDTVETNQNNKKELSASKATVTIDLYAKKACGATEPTIALVKDVIAQLEVTSKLNIMMLENASQANELKIIGVPTVRVNGNDIDPAADQIQKYGIT